MSHMIKLRAATRSRIRSGRTQCSSYIEEGTRNWPATDALFDLRKISASASVAPCQTVIAIKRH